MRKLFQVSIFVTSLLFLGCGDPVLNEVYYTYDDMVIKRIDQSNKTTLFYMEDGVPIDTIWTTYSGLTNSGFRSTLYFLEDQTILITDDIWHRKESFPHKFKIDRIDCPEYFEHQVINNVKHTDRTPFMFRLQDSLKQQGRSYEITLTNPETERSVFNKENPNTKVQTLMQYPQ